MCRESAKVFKKNLRKIWKWSYEGNIRKIQWALVEQSKNYLRKILKGIRERFQRQPVEDFEENLKEIPKGFWECDSEMNLRKISKRVCKKFWRECVKYSEGSLWNIPKAICGRFCRESAKDSEGSLRMIFKGISGNSEGKLPNAPNLRKIPKEFLGNS